MKRKTTQPIIQDMKKKGRTVCFPDNNENNVNADDEMSKSSLKKEEQRACLASPCFNFQWVVR